MSMVYGVPTVQMLVPLFTALYMSSFVGTNTNPTYAPSTFIWTNSHTLWHDSILNILFAVLFLIEVFNCQIEINPYSVTKSLRHSWTWTFWKVSWVQLEKHIIVYSQIDWFTWIIDNHKVVLESQNLNDSEFTLNSNPILRMNECDATAYFYVGHNWNVHPIASPQENTCTTAKSWCRIALVHVHSRTPIRSVTS